DERFTLLFVADVELEAGDGIRAMLGRDLGGDLTAVNDVGDHHLRPLACQRMRIVAADADRSARHDGRLACESCHEGFPRICPRDFSKATASLRGGRQTDEAIQTEPPTGRKFRLDCFVASLLAMTATPSPCG